MGFCGWADEFQIPAEQQALDVVQNFYMKYSANFKTPILIILISVVSLSCRKEIAIEHCSQNCKTLNIKGKFYDGVNNIGFSNMPVELKWSYFRSCIICPSAREIYSGRSDENGVFNFSIEVDSTFFNDYSLQLSTPRVSNYFELFPKNLSKEDLENDSLVNIDYYPIGNLKLNLQRVGTDSINKLSVSHFWKTHSTGETIFRQDYFSESPNIFIDTLLNIETVAEISTMVMVSVFYTNGNRTDISDSIVCSRNTPSILNMDY